MKNKITIIGLSILFIGILVFASFFVNNYGIYINLEEKNDNNVEEDVNIEKSEENNINSDEKEREENIMNILELTSEKFEEEVLKSEKTVLIDFYAEWCGPCKLMGPVVEKVAQENENLKVVKVNVDIEESLAIKYRIISIPTFVVIKNGEEVNRVVGMVDKTELEKIIK